jgi:putative copper resistance protein D
MLVYSLALLLLAFSFRVGGHISVLPLTSQVAIIFHFMAFALWIGSLYPLLMSSHSDDLASLQLTLKRFGDGAIAIVTALLAAGTLMLWELLDSWQEFITSAYGIALLIKFSLVLAILGLAVVNKLVLVPRLNREANANRLRISIRQEMGLAIAILMTTSYLSTIVGPAGH